MSAITATHLLTGPDEDFGPRADGMVTLHTFENADPLKNTMRDAIAGAIWQDRQDVIGSYGRIIAVDGVLLTVPDDHASGGINPASKYFNPEPWLFKIGLPREAIYNPNYFTLNLCAMGQCDWYDANGWPAGIIDGFARSIIDEERRIGRGVVVTNHMDFQDNRHDAGAICIDLVMKRYQQLTAAPEEDVDLSTLTPIVNRKAAIQAGAAARSKPEFNPKDYDANLISTEPANRYRIAIGWITGTNLSLNDGTVYDARTRWLMTDSDSHGPIFYHERDVTGFATIEAADCAAIMAELESTKQQVEVQMDVIAKTKTELATANSKITAAKAALA